MEGRLTCSSCSWVLALWAAVLFSMVFQNKSNAGNKQNIMRLAVRKNWSILLGFIITLFAFSGMLLAIFFPEMVSIDLTPNRSISALEVPLKNLKSHSDSSEVVVRNEGDPAINTTGDSYSQQGAPVQARRISSQPVSTNQQTGSIVIPNTGDAVFHKPSPEVPVRILIPSIALAAPVLPAPVDFETISGKEYLQWFVPDEYAVGWHTTSAMLGEPGNTVLNGHHNAYGEVFVSLVDVNEGDIILVESDHTRFSYQVTNKMILPEKYEQLDVRMNNAQWILPSVDERLTIITCWPYESNTHRLIIVARPLTQEPIDISFD